MLQPPAPFYRMMQLLQNDYLEYLHLLLLIQEQHIENHKADGKVSIFMLKEIKCS